MTILTEILEQKAHDVAALKKQPLPDRPANAQQIPSIKQTFANTKHMNIIAEIKRSSPSKGSIDMNVDPVRQAALYESCGASAISVLTDETFFHGSMDDLRAVRQAVDLPLLCKDFMIDRVQIDHAQAAGASIILLIVAALTPSKLQELYNYAKEKHLDVLCEVHNEQEMRTALDIGADVIGVNNRDLNTFTVDLRTTGRLAAMVTDPNTILVSESGIQSRQDVEQAAQLGARAALVGETLMRANDVEGMFRELRIPLSEGGGSHAR